MVLYAVIEANKPWPRSPAPPVRGLSLDSESLEEDLLPYLPGFDPYEEPPSFDAPRVESCVIFTWCAPRR